MHCNSNKLFGIFRRIEQALGKKKKNEKCTTRRRRRRRLLEREKKKREGKATYRHEDRAIK